MRVLKFQLSLDKRQQLELPRDAKLLMLRIQFGCACIWVSTEDEGVLGIWTIQRCITGEHIQDGSVYIGSIMLHEDTDVQHWFRIAQS